MTHVLNTRSNKHMRLKLRSSKKTKHSKKHRRSKIKKIKRGGVNSRTTKRKSTGDINSKTEKKRKLDIHEISGMIQWLIDLAGTDIVIQNLTKQLLGKKNPITIKYEEKIPSNPDNYKNHLIFITIDGKAGHWIYIDNEGIVHNSYVCHQKDGRNQFCQTFAFLYMLSNYWPKWKKLFPDFMDPSWEDQLKPFDFGHNIRVIVDFWHFIFFNTDDDIKNFLLDEVRQINNEYIKENKEEIAKCRAGRECSRSKLYTLVSDNTADINDALIRQKLKEIYDNADLIAKEA
jgi:hypothetical protein